MNTAIFVLLAHLLLITIAHQNIVTTYPTSKDANQDGVGGWGGQCTCPDGSVYWVGDQNNDCKSLACFCGVSGVCNKIEDSKWASKKVKCSPHLALAKLKTTTDSLEAANTDIAIKDAQIADKDTRLAAKDAELATAKTDIANKDAQISDKDDMLAAKDAKLAATNDELADNNQKLKNMDDQIQQHQKKSSEKDTQIKKLQNEINQFNIVMQQIENKEDDTGNVWYQSLWFIIPITSVVSILTTLLSRSLAKYAMKKENCPSLCSREPKIVHLGGECSNDVNRKLYRRESQIE